jgi:hypothetical protein
MQSLHDLEIVTVILAQLFTFAARRHRYLALAIFGGGKQI